jgi:hypothetical protein
LSIHRRQALPQPVDGFAPRRQRSREGREDAAERHGAEVGQGDVAARQDLGVILGGTKEHHRLAGRGSDEGPNQPLQAPEPRAALGIGRLCQLARRVIAPPPHAL